MNKTTLLIVAVLVIGGGWFFLSQGDKDHGHDHEHDDEHMHGGAEDIVAKEPVRADGEFTIATSFYPLAFALETLTEGVAEVTNIGEGRDPHDVQLSTQNIATMQQADLVVLQGAELEPWGNDIIEQLGAENVPVLLATHGLTLMEGGHEHDHGGEHEGEEEHHDEDEQHDNEMHHDEDEEQHGHEHEDQDHEEDGHHDEDEHDHGAYDPHTWLDPVLFSQSVAEMVEALTILDPENAALYEERGATLQAELATLDTEYTDGLANCALAEVITSHDAFGYLGERYDFEIHTIAGLSTQDLPSAQTLAELREEAEAGVGAILLEANSVSAYGETLAAETGLQTLSINPAAYLVPEGEDYFSIMRTNLATFADALQCN
jgi:zinc transport system substrate-binding protein